MPQSLRCTISKSGENQSLKTIFGISCKLLTKKLYLHKKQLFVRKCVLHITYWYTRLGNFSTLLIISSTWQYYYLMPPFNLFLPSKRFYGLGDWLSKQVSTKVIHTKYSKHRPTTVAHTFECVCSKINHGLNHGLFILLLKLINCPIH